MTNQEMTQATLDNWKSNHRQQIKGVPMDWLTRQAQACASLTRLEMQTLMDSGMSESEAWAEARSLFCMAKPPKYDH